MADDSFYENVMVIFFLNFSLILKNFWLYKAKLLFFIHNVMILVL